MTDSDLTHSGKPTRKALIYLRVSTHGQVKKDYDEEGLSLPAQREACERKASQLKAEVIGEFVEPGVSAKSVVQRKAFRGLLDEIERRGDIDYVIVWSVSRWARNQEDHWVARGMINRAGAELLSVKEPIGGNSSGQVMLEGVLAAVAAGRRLEIAEDVKRGITRKAEVGGTPYRAPLGYVNTTAIIDGREIRDVVIDEERAQHIRDAFTIYADSECTLGELSAMFEARGLRSKPNKNTAAQPLSPSRWSKILRNPYYLGIVQIGDRQYPGRHPALVDELTFTKVQEVLKTRRQNGARAWIHHHYLAGTLFCGSCGGRLIYSRNRGKHGTQYEYFVCIGKPQGLCDQPYHRLADIENGIDRFYGLVSLAPSERQAVHDDLLGRARNIDRLSERSLADQDRRLQELASQERKLLAAHYADQISAGLFGEEQQRLRQERAVAARVKSTLRTDLKTVETAIEAAVDLAENAQDTYRRAIGRERRLFNQGFFRALFVDEGTDIQLGRLTDPFKELVAVIESSPRLRDGPKAKELRAAFADQSSSVEGMVPPSGALSNIGPAPQPGSSVDEKIPPRRIELLLQA